MFKIEYSADRYHWRTLIVESDFKDTAVSVLRSYGFRTIVHPIA